MLVYRDRGLRVGLVLHDEEPDWNAKVDRYVFHFRTTPVPNSHGAENYTLFLNLSRSPEELLANVQKDTAYEIRRARDKDRATCEWLDTNNPRTLNDFWEFYEHFSSTMGYPISNKESLSLFIQAGKFHLSVSKTAEGEIVSYHAYLLGGARIRLRHACSMHKGEDNSARRALLGRVNRWHLWWDILQFQSQGIATYDFGGWYSKKDDPQMLRVNRFKEGFGGTVVVNYNCDLGRTLKGKLAIWVYRKLLGRGE